MAHYRSLTIQVTNNTGYDFTSITSSLNHGEWASTLPDTIKNGTSATCEAQSKDGALIGVTGVINMTGGANQGAFVINFNKPYGTGQTTIPTSCPAGYVCVMSGDAQGHNSSVVLTFSANNN